MRSNKEHQMSRKDYLVDVRVYNNNLHQAIKSMGFSSVPKFCEAYDLSYPDVVSLLSMKKSPLTKSGEVRAIVDRLLVIFGKALDDLFNEQQLDGLENNRAQREVDAEAMFAMTYHVERIEASPEDIVDRDSSTRIVETVLNDLKPKERTMLKMYYGIDGPAMTLNEIGKVYDMSHSRIGQIIAQAIKRLRHPTRAGYLRHAFLDDTADVAGRDEFIAHAAARAALEAKQKAEKAAQEKERREKWRSDSLGGLSLDRRRWL